jgi:PleD family two-component response regulator
VSHGIRFAAAQSPAILRTARHASADGAPVSGVYACARRAKSVFVLDGEAETREAIVRALSHEYDVSASHDALAAAEMMGHVGVPDVMLVSALLPGIDGFTFMRRMRSFAEYQSVPLLFLLPEKNSRLLARAIGEGARQCITKPISTVELLTRVRSCMA